MSSEHEETLTNDEALMREDSPARAEGSRGAAEGWLLGSGVSILIVSAALLLLPTVAPQFGWIVRALAGRGLTTLAMSVAGGLLTGLWLTLRTARLHSAAAQQAVATSSSTLEKLADQIAHMGDGLQGLRIEFVYLKDLMQSSAERTQTAAAGENQADAMYRLAASLDQLGLRVEGRLDANHREVSETLRGLSSAIQSVRTQGPPERLRLGDELDQALPEVRQLVPARRPAAAHEVRATSDGDADHEEDPQRERLGLLDLLDDLGRLLPRKTSLNFTPPEISASAFEGVQDEGWDRYGSIAAPLPAKRASDEIRLPGAGQLLGDGLSEFPGDASIEQKLEELRSLLADRRVREALTSIERDRE